MELRFRCAFASFYIKSEVQLVCQHSKKMDTCASAGHYEPQTYYVGLRGQGKSEAEGPKMILGPCIVFRRQVATIWAL